MGLELWVNVPQEMRHSSDKMAKCNDRYYAYLL